MVNKYKKITIAILAGTCAACLAGCSLPSSGPGYSDITKKSEENVKSPIPLISVDGNVTKILNHKDDSESFCKTFGDEKPDAYRISAGDSIDLYIWEAAPALLFGTSTLENDNLSVVSQKLPTQIVEDDGNISVPFAGKIKVAGKSVREIEQQVLSALSTKANDPQVIVQVVNKPADQITVMGNVKSSKNITLTPKGERLLDAVAAADGVTESYNKIMLRLTREGKTVDMPLETVIREGKENIFMNSGDVLVAMYQPWSFSIMGAAGKTQELSFEATGLSLVQALARSGGLNDNKAEPSGVFVFRYEDKDSFANLNKELSNKNITGVDKTVKKDGSLSVNDLNTIPVIYQIDFRNPSSFFTAQNFRIKNGDVVYVASASGYELSKFLRMLGLIVNPAMSWGNSVNNLSD